MSLTPWFLPGDGTWARRERATCGTFPRRANPVPRACINYRSCDDVRDALQVDDRPAGRGEPRLGERIEDPPPVAPVVHEPRVAQRPQVVRDERLPEPRGVHEVGDALLAGREELEQQQARLVTERPEAQRGDGAGAWV